MIRPITIHVDILTGQEFHLLGLLSLEGQMSQIQGGGRAGRQRFGHSDLGLVWDLEFGAWEFRPVDSEEGRCYDEGRMSFREQAAGHSQGQDMTIPAKYVHTNLVAEDWRRLARFYQEVFGCVVAGPERDYQGPTLEAATGVAGAHLTGAHLRLPGYGKEGPTLEIFSYTPRKKRAPMAINRPGHGHIAFRVEDVARAREAILAAGGAEVGAVVTLRLSNGAQVTWCYVTDPEGNVIELQKWS